MNPNTGWCHHCWKISCLKEAGYKQEDVAGNIMATQEFEGRCKFCNRVLRKVIVNVTEAQDD